MSDSTLPFGAGVSATDTTPTPDCSPKPTDTTPDPFMASERTGHEYKDCPRCLERFFGSDAGVWLNSDGVCRGCLTARSLRCPNCNHKVGSWHDSFCATIKRRGQLTEVFVTDCEFPR